MSQKLPKPVRNALARQAGGEVHPSPDVLTSFMERTLPRDESDIVTDHLAQCADCREVVFLASTAAEDVAPDKTELVAAPRRRWRLRLSWAVAAVAMLLVTGVPVWKRLAPANSTRPTASSITSHAQPLGSAQPAAPPTPAEPETQADYVKILPPKSSAALAAKGVGPKAGEKHPLASPMAAPAEVARAQSPAALGAQPEFAPPEAVPKNTFVQNQADAAPSPQAFAPPVKPMMSLLGVRSSHGQWRISSDGHLEHRVATDEWTRVLADEATTFHVVSVAGSDVWAGGSRGTLFHSDDSGESWSRVAIATGSGGAETGTIVSIQFSDPQHGTVVTSGGSRWSTSDGGATWARQ